MFIWLVTYLPEIIVGKPNSPQFDVNVGENGVRVYLKLFVQAVPTSQIVRVRETIWGGCEAQEKRNFEGGRNSSRRGF